MTLKDKMILYVYHKGNELENEKETLNSQRRYQIMDTLDMYENMRSEIRINALGLSAVRRLVLPSIIQNIHFV